MKCCRTGRCVMECEAPASPKTGNCPHPSLVAESKLSVCDIDTDCGENNDRKCCSNTGGTKGCSGLNPTGPKTGSCPDATLVDMSVFDVCNADTDCGLTNDRKCCNNTAGTKRCADQHPTGPKSGNCPDSSLVEESSLSNCNIDTDCGVDNARKCCSNTGGHSRCTSQNPTGQKTGNCPDASLVDNSPYGVCDIDSDCGRTNSRKCCSNTAGIKRCTSQNPTGSKSGDCPVASKVESSTVSNCNVDTDCGVHNDRKCCGNTSGYKRCSGPGTRDSYGQCISRVFSAQECLPEEIVNSCSGDGDCGSTMKCCQTGRCVMECEAPASPKTGNCPHPSLVAESKFSFCDIDTDCGENNDRKCCSNTGGTKRCSGLNPTGPKTGSCPDATLVDMSVFDVCNVDTDCGLTNDRKCCSNTTGTKRCAGQHPTGSKSGECPVSSKVESSTVSNCNVDTDCGVHNDRKCCGNTSGYKRCSGPGTRENPGQCISRAFSAQECLPEETVSSCSGDGDCGSTMKCCQTGRCVMECEAPASNKTGNCPPESQVHSSRFSVCEIDDDCGEASDRKCCGDTRGITSCVTPSNPDVTSSAGTAVSSADSQVGTDRR